MNATLNPAGYQLVPLTKMLLNGANAVLIADGVGVGKTIAAGYIIDRVSAGLAGPCLVVSPPTLVDKWCFELKSKFLKRPRAIRGREELQTTLAEFSSDVSGQVYVCSYSMLEHIESPLRFPLVVIDEIHNFRNRKTERWRTAAKVMRDSTWRVGLSATPINNAITDLGNECALLFPQHNPDVVSVAVEDVWGAKEFALLAPFLTRFTKEELGIHFAKRVVNDVNVRYPPSYAQRVQEVLATIRGRTPRSGSFPIDSITYYREASSSPLAFESSTGEKLHLTQDPKLEAFAEVVRKERSQILVFCQFVPTVQYLLNSLTDRQVFVLTGDVPVSDRESVVESFHSTPGGVMLLTAVGSEGLDLQSSNVVVNYDLHWNPMVLEQRIGRCDRIGQHKSEIEIYNFHVEGSIDDRIIQVLGKKLRLLAGSPLRQKGVVASNSLLYDHASVEAETKRASDFLRSFELAGPLRAEDTGVLPYLDRGYCRAGAVVGHIPSDWISGEEAAQAWIAQVRGSSFSFLDRLRRLGEYVA